MAQVHVQPQFGRLRRGARARERRGVRDTKHRELGALAFDTDQWVTLIATVTR